MSLAALSASPSKPTRIVQASFRPLQARGAAVEMIVLAQNLPVGGMPLVARVGAQPVQNLVPIGRGHGFTGTLARAPRDGDRLHLRYAESSEVATEVVYRGSEGPPRVA